MSIENLAVNRIIMHEVFQRKDSKNVIEPFYGQHLENLDPKALMHFEMRVADALSAQSKSLEMRIVKTQENSLFYLARSLLATPDEEFPGVTSKMADALADAQKSRGIPGGMLLVFDGTVGANSRPFVGVIKAEMQSGFQRRVADKQSVTEFIDNIFLTPATRLYKLAVFIAGADNFDDVANWRCLVFDTNISATRRENAAVYFYDGFLGCALPEDGQYETPRFFDLTKEFVRASVPEPAKRRDLNDALYTFIKVDQSPTFHSSEFAENYLPIELRDSFRNFLTAKKFPTDRGVARDISAMGARLSRRKYKFGSDIEFSVSAEAIQKGDVDLKFIPNPEAMDQKTPTWTQITIRRLLTDQS